MIDKDIGLTALPDGVADWKDARDLDPDYEALSGEVARMSSMTESASAPPDWRLVVDRGVAILGAKGKDIQVAAYMAVGLFHTFGMEGFSAGLKIIGDIFTAFAETAYPTRPRGRVNAVQWWLERADDWLANNSENEIEGELATEINANYAALDAALIASLADAAPVLAGLKAAIGRIPVKEPPPPEPEPLDEAAEIAEVTVVGEEAPVRPAAPAVSAPAAPANQVAAAAPTAGDPRELRRTIQTLLAQARDAGNALPDTGDFLPYRLRRLAAWSMIQAAPPAEDGRTLLEPPESHIAPSLDSQLESGNYQNALRLAEEQVGTYLFWLDPHRTTASALAAMGQTHQAALAAVQAEVLAFVKRFPSVTKLSFTDGTPFADARTKTWLASLGESGGGGGGADVSPAVREALDKARAAASVNPEEALDVLAEAARAAGHPRDALLVRIEVVKVFSASGKREAVLAQVPALLETIDRHGLEMWDRELAAQALSSAANGLDEELDAELLTALRQRLARTSPERYIRV